MGLQGQGPLTTISFVVSVTVIVCMTLAFAVLFFLYTKYKLKTIEGGLEDGTLLPRLEDEYEKTAEAGETAFAWLCRKNRFDKVLRVVMDALFAFLIIVLVGVSAIAIAFRVRGGQFFLGNTAYYAIQTGSMSEKSLNNPYYEKLPDNQIEQYALVGIKKVSEAELKLYDVVAFEVEGVVYVHRIVKISETDGAKLYTTMGDANFGSMTSEINMPFSRILGRYEGFQSLGLGVAIVYLQSNIGMIALLFAFLLLVVIDLSEWRIGRNYEERFLELAELLDGKANDQAAKSVGGKVGSEAEGQGAGGKAGTVDGADGVLFLGFPQETAGDMPMIVPFVVPAKTKESESDSREEKGSGGEEDSDDET